MVSEWITVGKKRAINALCTYPSHDDAVNASQLVEFPEQQAAITLHYFTLELEFQFQKERSKCTRIVDLHRQLTPPIDFDS